jgi:hypothetical protein
MGACLRVFPGVTSLGIFTRGIEQGCATTLWNPLAVEKAASQTDWMPMERSLTSDNYGVRNAILFVHSVRSHLCLV